MRMKRRTFELDPKPRLKRHPQVCELPFFAGIFQLHLITLVRYANG